MNRQSFRPAFVLVTAGTALLAAACGSSPSSTASGGPPNAGAAANAGGSASSQMVAYAHCMRSHGVTNFPDPDSSGQIPGGKSTLRQLAAGNSQYQAASQACQRLWPYQAASPARQQQELTDDLKFAQCMRSHGLPKFPDPTDSNGDVRFVISASRDGFDPHSPQVLAKARECQHVLPAGTRLPSVTVTS